MLEFPQTQPINHPELFVPMECFKLSPSDFAFLYEECPRCYYLKVKHGIARPRTPMATIYKQAEGVIVDRLRTEDLSEVVSAAPRGRLQSGERLVRSRPITIPGHRSTCFISGKFDLLIALEGGGYAVPDIKMSKVRDPNLIKYGRQLHSYAYALEHAKLGSPSLSPIERLGLIVFEPDSFSNSQPGSGSLIGPVNWVEIPRDDDAYLEFVSELVIMLERPVAPEPSPDCIWCTYRGIGR